jgi:hypothetical protein
VGKEELDNLVKIHRLKAEAASRKEFDGMLRSARTRLVDAQNDGLDPDSRFDLAYGAASVLLAHDLFRKPVPTFRDHATGWRSPRSDTKDTVPKIV